jgi:hypothetical protein
VQARTYLMSQLKYHNYTWSYSQIVWVTPCHTIRVSQCHLVIQQAYLSSIWSHNCHTSVSWWTSVPIVHTVTYSGCSIHDGTLLHSKSQYTTVKHSQQLLEHTYTSDPHSLGTLTPIEFFQQDLLWQSSNTHSHSCSHKASKHTSGQSIVGLSAHLHSTTAPRRIHH